MLISISYKIITKFGKTEIAKETFYVAKKSIKIWHVNIHNKVISKLVKLETNSKYLIWYVDKGIRPLVLIMTKMNEHVKTFKVVDKSNKWMSFCIDDDKLIEKYKAIGLISKTLKTLD